MKLKQNRRMKKKDHSGLLGIIILVVVFGAIAFLITSPPSSHITGQTTRYEKAGQTTRYEDTLYGAITSASLNAQETLQREDAFYGSIVNVNLKGQTTGVVEADTNCKMVANGLTNCLAIIRAADGSEIDFNYSHDMSKQPCLAAGDNVTIALLSDGTVKILRG